MPWWLDLDLHEQKIFSQNGEDGVLAWIFQNIGTTDRFCVEFGVQDGAECNTRQFLELHGWTGVWLDCDAPLPEPEHKHEQDDERDLKPPLAAFRQELIHAENINEVFAKHAVPAEFDLLSIDIDGNDYWVWGALLSRPRVVVIEYNSGIPPTESRTIRYDPLFHWVGTDYFGASLLALALLGKRKGYTLVYCESTGNNAFFVETSLIGHTQVAPVEQLYRPPGYGTPGMGHPHDKREWIEVELPPRKPERIGCC